VNEGRYVSDCGREQRGGKLYNKDADLGRAHHHGDVQRQHGFHGQFGTSDADRELGMARLLFWLLAPVSGLFNHRPEKVKSATAFYATFCLCFGGSGRWPATIPIETVRLRRLCSGSQDQEPQRTTRRRALQHDLLAVDAYFRIRLKVGKRAWPNPY
jgi:hypothetical protein